MHLKEAKQILNPILITQVQHELNLISARSKVQIDVELHFVTPSFVIDEIQGKGICCFLITG